MLSDDEVERLLQVPWGPEPDMPEGLVGNVMAAVQAAPRPRRWETWAAAALFLVAVLAGACYVPVDLSGVWPGITDYFTSLTTGWSWPTLPDMPLSVSVADSQALLGLAATMAALVYLNWNAARRVQA